MALNDLFARIEMARGAAARASVPVRRGQGLDALIASLKGEMSDTPQEPPSAFERGVATVFEKAPILRDVLMHFARLGSTVANVAEAGVYGIQGRGDEALGSLGAAGRQFTDFITNTLGAPAEAVGRIFGADDVVPNLSKPTDFRSFRDVLRTAGVGELGSVNLPLFGRVTGRGALGLGLDIASDPLTFAKIGAAAKGFVGPKIARNLLEPGETLLGAQARAGERSLLSFAGKPLVRGAPVLDSFEKVMGLLKNHPRSPFRAFRLYTTPEMRRAKVGGDIGKGLAERGVREGADPHATLIEGRRPIRPSDTIERLDAEIKAQAAKRGVPEATIAEEVLSAKEQLPVPRHATEARREKLWALAKRAEGKGQMARSERFMREHAAESLDPQRVAEADKAALRTLMGRYVAEGYTKSEAYRAATASILKGIDPDIAPLAASADRVLRGILQDENIRGVTVEALSDPYKSYITTAFSDEFKTWLRKNRKDPMRGEPAFRRWSARHPSTLRRDAVFEGRPLKEMEVELRKSFPEYGGRIFETDPRILIGNVRAQRLGRGVGTADYVDYAARNLARPATPDLVEAGWVRLGDVAQTSGKVLDKNRGILSRLGLRPEREAFRGGEKIPTQLKGLENLAVPPEIAAEMLKTFQIAQNTPPNILLGVFDGFTQAFKTGVTTLFPSFHIRNAVGNFWNNFIAGVWNPRSYADSLALLHDAKFGGAAKAWDVGGGRSMSTKQVIDHLDAGGALGYSGQFSEEELLKGATGLPLIKQGRRLGAGVESHAKIAHFIDRMRKGYSPEDAVLSIKKYLFDYSELSNIEKSFFRRVAPFFTFQRKNWPLILETLFTQPGKAAAVAHFDSAMRARSDGGGPIETTVLPGYISRRLLKLDEYKDGTLAAVSGFGLPFEDVAFLDRPFGEAMAMLNPLVKGPLQDLSNRDYFRDIPLDRSEYAPGFLRWARHVPGVGQNFLDAIGFREVKPDVYRANPKFLNWLWTFGASLQRGAGLVDVAGREGAGGLAKKYLSPVANRQYSPEEQIRQNYRRIVEGYVGHLEELQRKGVVNRSEDFYVRRDILPASPEALEARRMTRELGRFKSLLGRMSAAERAQARQEGLRSGGR